MQMVFEKLLGYNIHTIRDVHAHEQDFQSTLSQKI